MSSIWFEKLLTFYLCTHDPNYWRSCWQKSASLLRAIHHQDFHIFPWHCRVMGSARVAADKSWAFKSTCCNAEFKSPLFFFISMLNHPRPGVSFIVDGLHNNFCSWITNNHSPRLTWIEPWTQFPLFTWIPCKALLSRALTGVREWKRESMGTTLS